ncbi:hypothetical protein NRB14_24635, partial [Pseudomonas viridiflava]|uniref:hypothetical protein n=1 Tax=Pseudomonas viridiflava TaxID=33069 RepID=UPI00211D620F
LVGDAVDAVCQENRVIVHRRQAASYQTTCNLLKKSDFFRSALGLGGNPTIGSYGQKLSD